MTQAALMLPTLSVRKRRYVYYFDSRESALRWAVRNRPKHPAGAVNVCPPRAVKEGEAWTLKYTVVYPGHCKYRTLGRSGQLLG